MIQIYDLTPADHVDKESLRLAVKFVKEMNENIDRQTQNRFVNTHKHTHREREGERERGREGERERGREGERERGRDSGFLKFSSRNKLLSVEKLIVGCPNIAVFDRYFIRQGAIQVSFSSLPLLSTFLFVFLFGHFFTYFVQGVSRKGKRVNYYLFLFNNMMLITSPLEKSVSLFFLLLFFFSFSFFLACLLFSLFSLIIF